MASRRRMGALVALCLAAIPAQPLVAQRERAVVRVESFGSTDLSLPAGASAREGFVQQAVQVQLAHRFLLQQGNTIAIVGGQWRAVRAALPREQSAVPFTDFTTLQVAVADLMLLRTFGEKHTLVSVLRPGMYGETFRVEGAAFVDRVVSPRTTIGVGLSYASSFGELLTIPVLHVIARPSRRVLVDVLLPARADVWWIPRKGLDLGINASLVGANYGLSDARRVAGGDALWLANATVGPQLRWAPNGGKWQLTADGGITVLRRFEYARDGHSVADLAPGNVPFLRIGVQRLF